MRHYAILALAALLTACGGGGGSGGSSTSTATGYFKDSSTEGVRYVSGAQSGTTGADGSFIYEVGNTVSFYIGTGSNIPLGSTSGKSVVTPVDLVPSGTTSHQAVQNMTRFLMMLDVDGDPSNGIRISSAVRTAASGWLAVNFDQAEAAFATSVSSHVSAANSADGIATHALPNAATAQAHVEATLRCARSGGFRGSYSGSDRGPVGVMVDATSGMVTGYFNSAVSPSNPPGRIDGSTATTLDQSGSFSVTSGMTSNGATFLGSYSSPDAITGSWAHSATASTGNFSLSRIGGQANAVYRFTGRFLGSGYGLFTFDVSATNVVSGVAYDVSGDALMSISGTLSSGTLTATAVSTSTNVAITGSLNTSTGALSGSWSGTGVSGAVSGTFSGGGCKLN